MQTYHLIFLLKETFYLQNFLDINDLKIQFLSVLHKYFNVFLYFISQTQFSVKNRNFQKFQALDSV